MKKTTSSSSSCQTFLRKLTARHGLTQKEAALLMRELMSETLSDTLKAALLAALAAKGETIEEITVMAREMRKLSVTVPVQNPLLDTCGTGGSGLPRLNVSTSSAFILAACGVRVAKHGNRAASGRVGSFDVLEALGAKIELMPAQVARTIKETNLGFMFAPLYHPTMKNIMSVRRELGIRTVFNILGPLTNPSNAKYQVLGVSNPKIGGAMIDVLKKLGCKRALVVHGEDGLDEITVTTGTRVWELNQQLSLRGAKRRSNPLNKPQKDCFASLAMTKTAFSDSIIYSSIRAYRITPEQFGIKRVHFSKIKGGDAAYNATVIRGILDGTITDSRRDIILLNAAAGLYIYGLARSLANGMKLARKTIDEKHARQKLEEYITASHDV